MTRFLVRLGVFLGSAALAPLFTKLADRYASALLGGIGLITTFAALFVATLFSNGLAIRGVGSWIAATVVVWLVTAVATVLLPKLVREEPRTQKA